MSVFNRGGGDGGGVSGRFGFPVGAFVRLNGKEEDINDRDPAITDPGDGDGGDGGGTTIVQAGIDGRVSSEGELLFNSGGIASSVLYAFGQYIVTLDEAVEADEDGNWKMSAVANATSAVGAEEVEVGVFDVWSDGTDAHTDTYVGAVQFFYAEEENVLVVLGPGDDKLYLHSLIDFDRYKFRETTVTPGGSVLQLSSTVTSGCISREGTHIWLSGNATNGVRCTNLATEATTDFASTGDYNVVAAYNDGTNECVLIQDGSTLKKFTPDFGTPALGSATASWSITSWHIKAPTGTWDGADNVWFAPTAKVYMVDPAVTTTFTSFEYPVASNYSGTPLVYDSGRNVFYIQIGTTTNGHIYRVENWTQGVNDSAGFSVFKDLVEPTAIHYDLASDVLYTVKHLNPKEGIRYYVATGETVDTISIVNSVPNNLNVDANLTSCSYCFYKNEAAYFHCEPGTGGPRIWRARYKGEWVSYIEAPSGYFSGAGLGLTPSYYLATTNEILTIQNRYVQWAGIYWESRLVFYDITNDTWEAIPGTTLDPDYWQIFNNVDPIFVIDEWGVIFYQVNAPLLPGGTSTTLIIDIATRTVLGSWKTTIAALGAGPIYDFHCRGLDVANNRAISYDYGSIYIWQLSSVTHLPTAALFTISSGAPEGHMAFADANGDFWWDMRSTHAAWARFDVGVGTKTTYSHDADGSDANTPYVYTYDPNRNCIFYWGTYTIYTHAFLKKIDCDTHVISTIGKYPGDDWHPAEMPRTSLKYVVEEDRIFITGDEMFLWKIHPDTGDLVAFMIPESGSQVLFSSSGALPVCRSPDGVLWGIANWTGGTILGLARMEYSALVEGSGEGSSELAGVFLCQTRILSATEVRVDVYEVTDDSPAPANAPFSIHIGVEEGESTGEGGSGGSSSITFTEALDDTATISGSPGASITRTAVSAGFDAVVLWSQSLGKKVYSAASNYLTSMSTNRLLGRTTAGTGAIEEIAVVANNGLLFATQLLSIDRALPSDMETPTSGNKIVASTAVVYHPGVAKAHCSFDPSGAVGAFYNIASITDNGTGDWTVNTSGLLPLSASNGTIEVSAVNSTPVVCHCVARVGATSYQIKCWDLSGTLVDPSSINFAIYGDL